MKPRVKRYPSIGGFLLLEIIVSIALFALVGTAMVAALHHLGKTSRQARLEVALQRRFDSVMAELVHGPEQNLRIGTSEIPPEEGSGIGITVTVSPESLANREAMRLEHLYRVTLVARMENDPSFERETSRIVFMPPQGRTD